jgi:hypothetical protein
VETTLAPSQLLYLKNQAQELEEHERVVILQIDEIHTKPRFTFKKGTVTGVASNTYENEAASSVQAFMISSLFCNYKNIALLFPVKNMSAAELLRWTMRVINDLEESGFRVISIITDNNNINRKMFTDMSPNSKLNICVPHPRDQTRPLFLFFDTVHILKCIRNNWINLKDQHKTFVFPDPAGSGRVLKARFSHIRFAYTPPK